MSVIRLINAPLDSIDVALQNLDVKQLTADIGRFLSKVTIVLSCKTIKQSIPFWEGISYSSQIRDSTDKGLQQ